MEQTLLKILKEKGMRMSNLAAKLGVDQSNLSKKLKNDPKVSLIESIASVLDVPVSAFFPDQLPAKPAGVLDMGGKRFALVPFPVEAEEKPETLLEVQNLTPGELQEKICSLAQKSSKHGGLSAIYGFLLGHLVVVVHDGANKRYQLLFWETEGSVSLHDYPSRDYKDWECMELAKLIVHDIISTRDL